jgi:hypothetical protein
MDERPFPHAPLPQPPPSRRGFLVTGVLALVAAGGGAWLAVSSENSTAKQPPRAELHELRAAAAAEQDLIDHVDAALRHAQGASGDALRQVRADHVAHLTALRAAVADLMYPAKPAPAARSRRVVAGGNLAAVRAAEQSAAGAAAARAARLLGDHAALLASIAAAEATHAELLT